jgi:hypothetical protein
MSDDTLNAGSEQELPAEVVDATVDAASQETTADTTTQAPTGKAKALADTEAALNERKAEFTRLSQQLAELKGRTEAMMQMQTAKKEEEVKDWMDAVDDDKIVENPAMVKQMFKQLRQEFATVLQNRDAYIQGEIARHSASQIDPALRSVVDELKTDPDLADLPDAKLLAMAKRMGGAKKAAVMQPRGNIAGGQRAAPTAPAKDGDYTPEQLAWLKVSGTVRDGKRDDTLE